jgi:hypothetical protein
MLTVLLQKLRGGLVTVDYVLSIERSYEQLANETKIPLFKDG